jgi:D-serine deaminase-like pyridoxal phosphate-dependent protein
LVDPPFQYGTLLCRYSRLLTILVAFTQYGGGVHLSKDRISKEGGVFFGLAVESIPGSPLSWGDVIPGMFVRSLSQEHGLLKVPFEVNFDAYNVGDVIKVLPVHSCMTADLFRNKGYLTCDGEYISRMKF